MRTQSGGGLTGQRFPLHPSLFLGPTQNFFFQHPLVLWIRNNSSPGFPLPTPNSRAAFYGKASVVISAQMGSQGRVGQAAAGPCTCRSAGIRLQALSVTSHFSLFPDTSNGATLCLTRNIKRGRWVSSSHSLWWHPLNVFWLCVPKDNSFSPARKEKFAFMFGV